MGLWDLSGAAQGIVDGVISLMGLASTSTFLDSITAEATSERAVRRAQVAVALEQLGDPGGLSAAMKAWKRRRTRRSVPSGSARSRRAAPTTRGR